ncbi:glycine cleavage system protein H [Serratia silvae]|uniref:Glycine cleavage system protein H n=1 Tax=Serratia silvae TaxID=2824122 RepID=A0ABT0KAV3_9GAMM|nr:glycine cleavage system protein H [Serratia silvae]MCL1029169.1 glycine cleavage system protein H [Serratia silvae]
MKTEPNKYTPYFQWIRRHPSSGYLVGLTDTAQQLLGEIVYVELPNVGERLVKDQPCGCVESRKSVVDILAPCSGEVIAINPKLQGAPQLINHSAEQQGWLFILQLTQPEEWQSLLTTAPVI